MFYNFSPILIFSCFSYLFFKLKKRKLSEEKCSGLNNEYFPSPNVNIWNLWIFSYMIKEALQMSLKAKLIIKLRILRWGHDSWWLMQTQHVHRGLAEGYNRNQSPTVGDVSMEEWVWRTVKKGQWCREYKWSLEVGKWRT